MFDDLHDARLLALIIERDDTFVLRFKRENSEATEIVLSGVQYCRCDNFREGNIVFSFSLSTAKRVDEESLKWVLGWTPNVELTFLAKLSDQIHCGDLSLVELIPSYGAEFRAVVRGITRR